MQTKQVKTVGLWVALAVVAVLSLLWEIVPSHDAAARLRRLPAAGFQLVSRDVALSPVEAEIYKNATVIKRVYQAGHERFILLAIDGTHDRHAVHDPLYCFRGGGWTIGVDRALPVPGGNARVLELTRPGREVEVMFWITDGRVRHGSALRAWWQSTLRRLTFGTSGEEPLLFILQPLPDHTANWDNVVVEFPSLFDI
jgi:hypothetical protein